MNILQDITQASNQQPAIQLNFEIIERELLFPTSPTKVSGVETTIIGPPTAAGHAVRERWVDANGAQWECTVAGVPGTWRQIRPAFMAADPVAGTYPTGYLIARTDVKNRERVCTAGGTPGTWAWAGRGLTAIADLAGGATLGDTIAKVNAILASLRTAGEIAP